jgi:hypothetical protein
VVRLTPTDELVADYPVTEGCFDEAFDADGTLRAASRAGVEAVLRAGAADLPDRVGR